MPGQALGLELHDVCGDGNCLFRSLSEQLYNTDKQHAALRHEAIEFMRATKEDFAPFLDEDTTFERHSTE